jgi:hypothetical protein
MLKCIGKQYEMNVSRLSIRQAYVLPSSYKPCAKSLVAASNVLKVPSSRRAACHGSALHAAERNDVSRHADQQ